MAVSKGQLGTGRFAMEPNKPDALRISPRMDAATVDLANRLVDEITVEEAKIRKARLIALVRARGVLTKEQQGRIEER